MAAALASVKEALGPDAMILETGTPAAGKGVEVTAAVDDDPPATVAPVDGDAVLASEMRELSGLVRALIGQAWAGRSRELGTELGSLYASLVSHGVDGKIAANLIEETATRMAGGVELTGAVAAAVGNAVMFGLLDDDGHAASDVGAGPRVRVFFGPPGDGKTTTLAKLAGRAVLYGKRRVALVSADTYRIAGADELAAYARILGVPFAVVSAARELERVVEELGPVQEVLIDTAGITPHDRDGQAELRSLAESLPSTKRTLVLSATAAPAVTRRVWDALRSLCPDSCIVTKVDEAPAVGALETLWRQDLPLAFFGTGRRIPQDLETASPERMAEWLTAA
jgi:flagellar biosynthesis protein FlhF